MAEETPSNLGGLGAGFLRGVADARGLGDRRLDRSIDRLEHTLDKFSDTLQRLTGVLHKTSGSATGTAAPGGTTQSTAGLGNGGAVTFGGVGRGTPPPTVPPVGGYGSGWNMGNGGQPPPSGGGVGGPPPGQSTPGGAQPPSNGSGRSMAIGRAVGVGAVVGLGVYTANHAANQVIGQTLASQYSTGRDFMPAYRSMFTQNYTAASSGDLFAAQNAMASGGGFAPGSSQYNRMSASSASMSLVNPAITNAQAMGATLSMGSTRTFNMMQGMGITTMNRDGTVDIQSIAKQILDKMGGRKPRDAAELAAAFGPSGSATLTVQSMVDAGFIPAKSAPVILEAMRGILKAGIHGVSYSAYRKDITTATTDPHSNAGKDAINRLKDMGIRNSITGEQRVREGMSRDSEAETVAGFTKAVEASTRVLEEFRSMLNGILKIPGVGEIAGASSGATSVFGSGIMKYIPGAGILSKGLGMLSGAGGAAPRMSTGGYGGSGSGSQARAGGGSAASSAARSSAGGGTSGRGSAGVKFIAPRPGIDQMSSEQDFGPRTIGQGFHTGIDLLGPAGAPIKAAAAGTVQGAGWGASGDSGYGNTVMINHGGGYVSMYAHMSSISVHKGATVRQGQIIGAVGNTGSYSQGAHLHFEIHINGKPVNPAPYIGGGKVAHINNPPGGGNSGSTSGGGSGTGADMGSTGSFANAASPADGGAGGTYSEVAALGLGGGFAGGGVGSPTSSPTSGGGGGGGGGGGVGSGAPGTVRTGTYNLKFSTSSKQNENDLRKLMGKSDVLGLTEVFKKKGLLSWLGKQGWGTYKGRGDAALTWDKNDYDLLKHGDLLLNRTAGAGYAPGHQYAAYGLFKDKSTGSQFWEIAAHTIARAAGNAGRSNIKNEQFNALSGLVKRLGKGGTPVFLVGDLNQDLDRGDWRGIAGLSSNWKKGQSGMGTHGRGNFIDHIMSNPDLAKLIGTEVVGGLSSDHNAALAQYKIGGGSNGSGGHYGKGGSPAANMAIGRKMAADRGWGSQWNALRTLWMHESGWRVDADNPTSSAYGIPQGLVSGRNMPRGYYDHGTGSGANWHGYGGDASVQIGWGLNYIKGRYHDPNHAWAFWQRNHWYDSGEWNIRDDADARVHKGEMILPTKVAEAVRNELTAPGIRGARGGGAGVVFEANSIQIHIGHGNMSKHEARQAGTQVVDAIVNDRRMRQLAEG